MHAPGVGAVEAPNDDVLDGLGRARVEDPAQLNVLWLDELAAGALALPGKGGAGATARSTQVC